MANVDVVHIGEIDQLDDGRATFLLDGDERDAPAGTLVYVEPGVMRSATAREPGTTVLAIGAGPEGAPYEPYDWEPWAPLQALYRAGRYEEMIEQARPLLTPDPEHAALYYDVACGEVRAGRHDDALEHLRIALEQRPGLAGPARQDTDFDAIRDRPECEAIVGEAAV
jgi:tetratricopeptide (TPR) repeat protein